MSKVDLLKNKVIIGVDGVERNIEDLFEEEDFDVSEDSSIFIRHSALSKAVRKHFFIEEYSVDVHQSPQKNNDWCACVTVRYSIKKKNAEGVPTEFLEITPYLYNISASADCNKLNASRGFGNYTTAFAETRASARALKHILGLDDLCSTEESNEISVIDCSDKIDDNQKNLIETKYLSEGGDLEKLGQLLGRKLVDLEDLTKSEALEVIKFINKEKNKKQRKIEKKEK